MASPARGPLPGPAPPPDGPGTAADDLARVTRALREGDRSASELLPLVYDELRKLAAARLARAGREQTLQATALVHEAWVRVVGHGDPGWEGRAHFFGAAARAMRNVLVERQRRRTTLKRDGGARASADEQEAALESEVPPEDLLAVDEALARLEARDPLKARLVELRFFAGLAMPEVAQVMGLPLSRVEREWRFTRAWLGREVEGTR